MSLHPELVFTPTSVVLSGYATGSVLFAAAGGVVGQDNSNFFWDVANHSLGIGGAPSAAIRILSRGSDDTSGRYAFYADNSVFTVLSYARNDGLNFANRLTIGVNADPGAGNLYVGNTAGRAQTFNAFTDASNYENAYMGDWGVSANVATYGTGKAGAGSTRNAQMVIGGAVVESWSGAGSFSPFSTTILNATAIPAGGTAGAGFKFSSASNFGIFFGSGAPTLSAGKGSLYLRSDGTTTNNRAYINTDGSTTWTALTTVA